MKKRNALEKGQSLTEYLIVTVFAAFVLIIPYNGDASAMGMIEKAIHDYYQKFTYAISLPVTPIP